MAYVLTYAYSAISQGGNVLAGARRVTTQVRRFLDLEKVELSADDKQRLSTLEKRIYCLSGPFNYLLEWSKDRDSCLSPIIFSAQQLLLDSRLYMERFMPQDCNSPAGVKSSANEGLDVDKIQYFLKELDWCTNAVGMAINISKAIDASSPVPEPAQARKRRRKHREGSQAQDKGDVADHDDAEEDSRSCGSWEVLPNSRIALLRASRRILEMRGRSGDLCTFSGRLYFEVAGPGKNRGDSGTSEARPTEWAPKFSQATFRAVAQEKKGKLRYSFVVDSRLPLSQRESSGPILPAGDAEDANIQTGLMNAATEPLEFSIDVALDACLTTTAGMNLPLDSTSGPHIAGIDSYALIWSSAPSASDPSLQLETYSTEFEAVVLTEPAASASSPCRAPSPWSSLSPTRTRSNGLSPRYVFVFDSCGNGEARSVDAGVTFTPLDADYLLRLCAYDDGQSSATQDGDSFDVGGGCYPPHLSCSDEALELVLKQQAACRKRKGT